MQKWLIVLVFILLIITTLPVYSLSLFPTVNKDNNIINNIQIASLKEVHYDKKNTLELVIESNYNYKIDGLIVKVSYDNSEDTTILDNDLNPYSTKIYQINTKNQPISLDIRFYNDINHKRNIINQVITYQITGNENNIVNQPQQIIIQQEFQQQPEQQQFNSRPSYISYSSYSKLDDNKNIIYFTKDHISSNRITTNNNGNIQYKANYQPYGEIFKETGEESYKYSNKELDSSNLYYFGARYYDPSIGRFTQVDPIFKLQESPYMYANNNPLKYIDPTGKILKISQEICDYLCDIGVDPEYLLQSSPTLKRLDERQEMFTFSYPQSEEDFMEIYENGPWGFVLDKSTTAIINPDETQDPARLIGTIIHEGSHLLGNAEKTSAWERESELPTDLNYVFYYLEEMRASKASARELQKLRNNPKFERINFEQVITAQAIYHSAMGVELIQLSSKPTKIKNLNTINFNIAYTMLRHQYVDPSLLFIAAANGYNPLIALNKGDTDSWRDLMK